MKTAHYFKNNKRFHNPEQSLDKATINEEHKTRSTKASNPVPPSKGKHSIKGFDVNTFKQFKRMLVITLPQLFPESFKDLILVHTDYILHLYQSKGPEYVVRYLKATHESLEHCVLELSKTLEHEKVSIGKDKSSWPKWLGTRLKRKCQVDKDPVYCRYVLTLCSTRRLIVVPTFTSLKSITATPSALPSVINHLCERVEKDISRHARFFDRRYEIGKPDVYYDEDTVTTHPVPGLEVSLKSGPNGVSMFSFPWDRAAVFSHNLCGKIQNFLRIFYTGDVEDWLESKIEPYEGLVDSNRRLHTGKISLTFEGGKLKPRVFAIVDSLTQSILAPFHRGLMTILRTLPEDCTFDHSKVQHRAKELHLNKHDFYGYADLSNASDAIDRRLYEYIGNV